MKFIWLNKQGVKNESGEIVQRTGRFSAEYKKDWKVIQLSVESGFIGGPSISYRRKDFEKWSHGEELPVPEREQAIKTFRAALIFQGLIPEEL